MEGFFDKVSPEPNSGCWLWMGAITNGGYGSFKRGLKAHRISWEIHRNPIPEGFCVCHKCDVRSCVNPDHLFLGTYLDNHRDMVAKGHQASQVGSLNSRTILTEQDIPRIRAHLKNGKKQREVAAIWRVNRCVIANISIGKTWTHVP
ncbi:MAG: HNH endonuclease signature motif containing protein [Pseudomonadales bacterium]